MMLAPFKIKGPACVRFSGGRTSGMMICRILEAHGGALPDDVRVTFSNTGKERGETLDFVRECQMRFGVRIRWIEYVPSKPFFVEVDYSSANRDGKVFERMVDHRGYMPNPAARTCTSELKIKPSGRFMKASGLRDWTVVLGLRADEPDRVAKQRGVTKKRGFGCIDAEMPLALAGVTKADVKKFWTSMPFDLQLEYGESNCDLCFLRSTEQRVHLMQKWEGSDAWWIRMEKKHGMQFRRNALSYEALSNVARNQTRMHLPVIDDSLGDCTCTD